MRLEQVLDFLPQICYNLGVEATNYIADFAALCYGNSCALYATRWLLRQQPQCIWGVSFEVWK